MKSKLTTILKVAIIFKGITFKIRIKTVGELYDSAWKKSLGSV